MTKTTALATGFAVALAAVGVQAQRVTGTAETHLAAAKAAAGTQWTALQQRVCESAIPAPPAPRAAGAGEAGRAGGGGRQAGPPPPSQWHVEPAKVFDNLYFVGMTDWSAWALTTSQGIIVIDAIFDYSVEDEVVNGLKKLGLNPADIKYVLISHAHTDHIGGAKYLRTLLDTFHGDLDLTLAAYNAGPGAVQKYNGVPPFRETQAYVTSIRTAYQRSLQD